MSRAEKLAEITKCAGNAWHYGSEARRHVQFGRPQFAEADARFAARCALRAFALAATLKDKAVVRALLLDRYDPRVPS